jgi:hypothetical protein
VRANELAAKSESMARELSQKREMRIRHERVRQLASDAPPDAAKPPPRAGARAAEGARSSSRPPARPSPDPAFADDKTVRREDLVPVADSLGRRQPQPLHPEPRLAVVDDVAVELEELMRDMRASWRRIEAADRITMIAALSTLCGVLLPWLGDKSGTWQIGLHAGGAAHGALAIFALVLVLGRHRRYDARGERLSGHARARQARRASLWHLLLGAASTLLCAYFLVVYGLQRPAAPGLQIKFGLYITLAAGMGLSYGGFARFWSRHEGKPV